MNNLVWDAVLWLRKKLNGDKKDIIQAVNNIQNLFETSVDATASASDILEGQTAYNGTTLLTGSMKDRRGTTVTSEVVTQDANYTYFAVPEEACYNENSKVRALNSNIYDNIYNAIVAQGITPSSKTPDGLVDAISALATNKYNAGNSAGYNTGYNAGYSVGKNEPKSISVRVQPYMYQAKEAAADVYINNNMVISSHYGTSATVSV